MRLSVFNQYVAGFPDPEDTLIHNTFSGAYVVLATRVVELLRADQGELLCREESAELADPELRDPDVGIVVTSHAAEEAEFQSWFARHRNLRSRLEVMVAVNLACNFECSYCLQAGVLDGTVVNPETADATADWVIAHCRSHQLDEVHLSFVGGEPLLHPQRIKRIARRVRQGLGDASLTFSVITNGYFLSQHVVAELIPLGLRGAQVTLDGDATTHSMTRRCKTGEDTFQRILDNLISVSRLIRVSINGNYQPDTIHGFAPLIRQLATVLPTRTNVAFSPALDGMAAPVGAGSGACSWSGSDTTAQVALHDEAVRCGFTTVPLNAVGPCELHDVHAFAVDPQGVLYKCPGFLGFDTWRIGDVWQGLSDRYAHMLSLTPKQLCGGCSHRPNCGGGCVAAEWIRTGDTSRVNCEHSYFESVKRAALMRGYVAAVAGDATVSQTPASPKQQVRSTSLRVLPVR